MHLLCGDLLLWSWFAFRMKKIKRFLPYLLVVLLFAYLYEQMQVTSENVYYIDVNPQKEPLAVAEIKKDKYIICSDCGMMIKSPRTSAQVVTPSGRTYFFDDIGCMVHWLNRQEYKEKDLSIFVFVPECSCYIDAEDAWYIRDGITPIGYGVVAYGTSLGATRSDLSTSSYEYGYESLKEEDDDEKQIYEYADIKRYILRGETMQHPIVRKLLLEGKLYEHEEDW